MYSLLLTCTAEEADLLSGELWEAGTAGVQEIEQGEKRILIASFEGNKSRANLVAQFTRYSPRWQHTEAMDWVEHTRLAWPGVSIGMCLFLAPPWSRDLTPAGRERIVHNPGLACGTGEHPCTQLALMALEKCITPGCRVVDVGTGSGILAIAALRLAAEMGVGVDTDTAAFGTAAENFRLNDFTPALVTGSAECLASGCSDVTVANLCGTVLLSIMDELIRITRANGYLILTGFPESEVDTFRRIFPDAEVSQMGEWHCLVVVRPS